MKDTAVSNSIHNKSPLDTLVRQSSRRAQNSPRLQPPSTPVRPGALGSHDRDPSSPLLHTRFRTSASTAMSSDNSFMDFPDETTTTTQDLYWNRDDASVYSSVPGSPDYSPGYSPADEIQSFAYVADAVGDQSPTLPPSPTPSSPSTMPENYRQSWASHESESTVHEDMNRHSADTIHDTWRSNRDPFSFHRSESPRMQVPEVVVSSPPNYMKNPHDPSSPTGSHTSAVPVQYSVSNFSRPIRPPAIQEEDSKRSVLDRNRPTRQITPTRPAWQQQQQHQAGGSYFPSEQYYQQSSSPSALHPSPHFLERPNSGLAESRTPAIFRSSSANAIVSNSQDATPSPQSASTTNIGRSMSANAVASSSTGHIRLPNSPPSPRVMSRASLYSTYSFYQLEDGSRTSSPSSPQFPAQEAFNPNFGQSDVANVPPTRSRSRNSPPTQSSRSATTPEDYLLLGIQHHEANRLAESATCFERAATIDGGCGVGMLMWGLSLRHAWGTTKDEKSGFRWLRRAAEAAVGDLEAAREGRDQKAVKTELVLAIFEVGQCFFHGWGVSQDKKMAVSYFQVAARLGDGDAQQELGYCLANGKGCKKDLKEAAKWYRAAAAQGASTVGLAWIYKPKYL